MPDSAISASEYSRFIEGLELDSVWLQEESVSNHIGPRPGVRFVTNLDIRPARWEKREGGFRALQPFVARFAIEDHESSQAEIHAVFALDYASPTPMTDDLFAMFSEHNVPVNAYPYLRALVAELTGRMGWTPFTAPLMKLIPSSAAEKRGSRGPSKPKRLPNEESR